MRKLLALTAAAVVAAWFAHESARAADTAKIVLVAGRQSHGPGDHEFNAGCKLLAKCLGEVPGIEPVFVPGGWPKDESVFEGARAVLFFMDGGGGHPIIQQDHLEVIQKLIDKGVGIACLHYAVEVPKGKPGDKFLDWIGGYYESGYSTNPHWVAAITSLPEHPITRGVKPFATQGRVVFQHPFSSGDERGHADPGGQARRRNQERGLILATRPVRPHRRRQRTRRGAGLGGRAARRRPWLWIHRRSCHKNWGDPNFRKLVLNAILWTAKLDVPAEGVECKVSEEELKLNLDPKR